MGNPVFNKGVAVLLDKELRYFEAQKAELLKHHENQFVLIKDEQLIGAFTTPQEAYQEGIQRLGNQPFLIKQVTKEEVTAFFPALTLGLIHAHL